MTAFDHWIGQFPFFVQIGIYAIGASFLFFLMRWLLPVRREVVKRKVKGEAPGSFVRAAMGALIVLVSALWVFGLPPFGPWWDPMETPVVGPRSVPFVVEDPCYKPCYPICPNCGRRHP